MYKIKINSNSFNKTMYTVKINSNSFNKTINVKYNDELKAIVKEYSLSEEEVDLSVYDKDGKNVDIGNLIKEVEEEYTEELKQVKNNEVKRKFKSKMPTHILGLNIKEFVGILTYVGAMAFIMVAFGMEVDTENKYNTINTTINSSVSFYDGTGEINFEMILNTNTNVSALEESTELTESFNRVITKALNSVAVNYSKQDVINNDLNFKSELGIYANKIFKEENSAIRIKSINGNIT